MKNNNISPFKHLCITIGNLPSSYVESLSYYEALCWLYNFLNTELIEDINENTEAVRELQEKYVELKSYVDNYFDNLDVQEEIDNKLDEMAESGQLADIIALYLNANCILAYNNIVDLKAAENLTNGSFARIYGKVSYNDGLGAYYKIRNVLTTDVIDDDNIVSITADPTIIAEKIPDNFIGNLSSLNTTNKTNVVAAINEVNSNLSTLETSTNSALETKQPKRKFILVGDSYAEGYGNDNNKGWGKYLIEYLAQNGIPAQEIYEGGIGFVAANSTTGHTFKTLLQTLTVDDPDSITDIVVIGGYNDKDSAQNTIEAAIDLFIQYCKETYENAKVYLGMVGNNGANTSAGIIIRNDLRNKVLPAYKNVQYYGGIYLDGIENSTHIYSLFYSDNVHLTNYVEIARSAFNILMGGGSNVFRKDTQITVASSGLTGINLLCSLNDNNVTIKWGQQTFNNLNINWTSNYIEVSNNVTIPFMRETLSNGRITIPFDAQILHSGGTSKDIILMIIENSKVMYLYTSKSYSGVYSITMQSTSKTFDSNCY